MSTYAYREWLVGDIVTGVAADDLAVYGARERIRSEHLVAEGAPRVTRSTEDPGPEEPWSVLVEFDVRQNREEGTPAAYELALTEMLERRPLPPVVCGSPMRRHVFGPLAAEELRDGVRSETRCSECHRIVTRDGLLELATAEGAGEPWWAQERPFDVLRHLVGQGPTYDAIGGLLARSAVELAVAEESAAGRSVVRDTLTLTVGEPFEAWHVDPDTGLQDGTWVVAYRVAGRSTWVAE